MIRNAWVTFNGLVLLFGLHTFLVRGLLNGRMSPRLWFISSLLIALPAAALFVWHRGVHRTADMIGGLLGAGTLLLGFDYPVVGLRVVLWGQALTAVVLLLETQGIKPTKPTAAATQPTILGAATPQPTAASEIRSSSAYRCWQVLTLVPLMFALLIAGAAGLILLVAFTQESDQFDEWGGLGLLYAIAFGVIAIIVIVVGLVLVLLAKRHPKVGVGLSLVLPLAALVVLIGVPLGRLGFVLGLWALAYAISGVGVLIDQGQRKQLVSPTPAPTH